MLTPLLVSLLLGQVKAQPCRPTVACTAELVPQGNVEVELGAAFTPAVGAVNALAKVSVLDWLQLQLGTDNLYARTAQRRVALDGAVGALKARLLSQGSWWPTVALSTRVVVPTQPPLPALQATLDWGATAHVSKDVGALHFDVNGTVSLFGLAQAQGQAAFVTALALPRGLGLALEVHSTFGNAQLANDGGVRAVLSWSPVDRLVFDLGGDVGFFPGARAFTLFAGFVFVPTSP